MSSAYALPQNTQIIIIIYIFYRQQEGKTKILLIRPVLPLNTNAKINNIVVKKKTQKTFVYITQRAASYKYYIQTKYIYIDIYIGNLQKWITKQSQVKCEVS